MDIGSVKDSSVEQLSIQMQDIGYFTLKDAAVAFSIQTEYRYYDCLNMLFYALQRGYIKPADVHDDLPGVWEPIKSPDGKLEGWIHSRCGRGSREASKFCPECGRKMELPKIKFQKMGKRHG